MTFTIDPTDLFLAAKLLELAGTYTAVPSINTHRSDCSSVTDVDTDDFAVGTPIRKKSGVESTTLSPKKVKRKRTCVQIGCNNYAIRNQVCWSHGANMNGKRCKVEDCNKHAQQGGVCISHGAKRKRYLCTFHGCQKHAVQGRLCVGHGAKLVRCTTLGCRKQMVSGGYCTQCLTIPTVNPVL